MQGATADTASQSSQLDDGDIDAHATDMVISMLDEDMLEGVPWQGYPRATQPRQLPPEQPPPMPELSSAATVLEGQRQTTGSVRDQAAHEPPRIHPARTEEVAQSVSTQVPQDAVAQGTPDSAQPWEERAAQWQDTDSIRVALQQGSVQGVVQVPTGQPEMTPTPMPFSTACAVALCILGAICLGQNEEHIEARGGSRALHLLHQRQQEDFVANQTLPGEGATSEQRIQAARLKVRLASFRASAC